MPYGIIVKVHSNNSAAPVNEPFSMRVSVRQLSIGTGGLYNTENISRWYPISGVLQVATYVEAKMKIVDALGQGVAGEQVQVDINRNTKDNFNLSNATVYLMTASDGTFDLTQNLPTCTGAVDTATYHDTSSPPDYWRGTSQTGTVKVSLPNAATVLQTTLPFLRICTETYYGHTPPP